LLSSPQQNCLLSGPVNRPRQSAGQVRQSSPSYASQMPFPQTAGTQSIGQVQSSSWASQTPSPQTGSENSHAPSTHASPSGQVMATDRQPTVGKQLSVVQGSLSSHVSDNPLRHDPPQHESTSVQMFPSSQSVPSGLAG
jgi:hypothetical protein